MDSQQLLNETIAIHTGCLRFVDCFVVNRNNGGINIRFFFSKAKFSIVTLYENDFWRIPPELKWVAEKAKQIGEKLEPERAAITEYEPAKRKGLLIDMPLAYVLRYQFDPGEDQEKWRFHGFYKVFRATQNKEESKQEVEVQFKDLTHALTWAINNGAYQTLDQAQTAFRGLYERTKLEKEQLHNAWRQQVKNILNHKSKNGKVPA